MTTSRINLNSQSLSDAMNSISRTVDETTRLGIDLLDSFSRLLQSSLSQAPQQLSRTANAAMDRFQKMGSMSLGKGCCEIPPPCWMPQPACDVVSHVCPGVSATVRVCVTNCDFVSRTITIEAPANSGITIDRPTFTLGPLERSCATLTLAVAAGSTHGHETENLILVRGCRVHYFRWTVAVSSRGGCTCHEVEIEDCADYIHHWYDHFYCRRPCTGQR